MSHESGLGILVTIMLVIFGIVLAVYLLKKKLINQQYLDAEIWEMLN